MARARLFALVLIALLGAPSAARAEDARDDTSEAGEFGPWFRRHHFVIGMGAGAAFESDTFNVGASADPTRARPWPAYDFAYAYNLNAQWAFGVHLRGYSQTFHDYVSAEGGPARARFKLDTYNQLLRVERFFARGRIQPYAYLEAGAANGQVDGEGDVLEYSGASAGAGCGARVVLTRNLGAYADGVLSLGSARWEDKPFGNSASRDFNPSYWAVTLGAALLIP